MEGPQDIEGIEDEAVAGAEDQITFPVKLLPLASLVAGLLMLDEGEGKPSIHFERSPTGATLHLCQYGGCFPLWDFDNSYLLPDGERIAFPVYVRPGETQPLPSPEPGAEIEQP